ncbi:MAG: translational machinery protein [Polyangiaceae bacterium]|nr:translational machinery protein [Polyangiaceae bacterium]
MKTFHAAVWLDHNEARIFHIDKDGFNETVIVPEKPHRHLHRKSGPGAVSGRRGFVDPEYFDDVAKSLNESEEILVLGPSTAKLELIRHITKRHSTMVDKVVGVETVDHPTDRQIVAYARKYFEAVDQTR